MLIMTIIEIILIMLIIAVSFAQFARGREIQAISMDSSKVVACA